MKRVLPLVLTMLTFLAGVAVDSSYKRANHWYQITQQQKREKQLREELAKMRNACERYEKDKGSVPSSVADLVQNNYLDEVPIDPMTGFRNWDETAGWSCWEGLRPTSFEIHSTSQRFSLDGSRYYEW